MLPTEDVIHRHLRPELKVLLSQCTEKQQAFFKKMYGSVDTMPVEKIPRAIQQCEATITKNNVAISQAEKE